MSRQHTNKDARGTFSSSTGALYNTPEFGGQSAPSIENTYSTTSFTEFPENLVRPTWQNVGPGEISTRTLEIVNGLSLSCETQATPPTRPQRSDQQRIIFHRETQLAETAMPACPTSFLSTLSRPTARNPPPQPASSEQENDMPSTSRGLRRVINLVVKGHKTVKIRLGRFFGKNKEKKPKKLAEETNGCGDGSGAVGGGDDGAVGGDGSGGSIGVGGGVDAHSSDLSLRREFHRAPISDFLSDDTNDEDSPSTAEGAAAIGQRLPGIGASASNSTSPIHGFNFNSANNAGNKFANILYARAKLEKIERRLKQHEKELEQRRLQHGIALQQQQQLQVQDWVHQQQQVKHRLQMQQQEVQKWLQQQQPQPPMQYQEQLQHQQWQEHNQEQQLCQEIATLRHPLELPQRLQHSPHHSPQHLARHQSSPQHPHIGQHIPELPHSYTANRQQSQLRLSPQHQHYLQHQQQLQTLPSQDQLSYQHSSTQLELPRLQLQLPSQEPPQRRHRTLPQPPLFLSRFRSPNTQPNTANQDYDFQAKVILLGDSGVGKTSVMLRYGNNLSETQHLTTTVGIDFMNKVVYVDGTKVKLQIWDTAGQERFKSVTHAYYRDAHALLLLYDVTNKITFDNIRAWLCEIREYAQEDVVIILLGNKADASNSERQVKKEDGERLAGEYNVPFMETSAKTGLNIELSFAAVARQLKSRGYENGRDGRFNVHDFVRDNTQSRSMCAQCRNM